MTGCAFADDLRIFCQVSDLVDAKILQEVHPRECSSWGSIRGIAKSRSRLSNGRTL
jgi:hypothetical protein